MLGFLYSWFLVLVCLWISWIKTQTLPNLRLPISSTHDTMRAIKSFLKLFHLSDFVVHTVRCIMVISPFVVGSIYSETSSITEIWFSLIATSTLITLPSEWHGTYSPLRDITHSGIFWTSPTRGRRQLSGNVYWVHARFLLVHVVLSLWPDWQFEMPAQTKSSYTCCYLWQSRLFEDDPLCFWFSKHLLI